MDDQDSSAGPDRARGANAQDERAGGTPDGRLGGEDGQLPEGQGDHPENETDETRDTKAGERRGPATPCGYCRRDLPEQTGRARPYEYCPPGTGPYEHIPDAGTCKQLAAARRRLRAAHDTDSAAEVLLSEHVTAVLDVLAEDGPIAALRADLTGVRAKLADDVATMRTERDAAREAETKALAQSATDNRLRRIAEGQATEAYGKQAAAERDRNTKVSAAEDRATKAEKAKREAEHAQGKAEGERDQHQGRADRADEAAETARNQRDEAIQANTALTIQVENLTTLLEQANTRANEERARADKAAADAETKLDQGRKEADAKIEKARADATAAVEAARGETARQAAEHGATLERLGRERADELVEHARLLADATGRTEQLQQRVRHGLARLLRDATIEPVDPGQDDDPFQQLLRVTTAQADLRHGLEDLARELELD